ncbi:hypothetical protein K2173_007463 [Erythroxylum novogranatense]|uniref:DUF4283 domain-containing protein n=1 Tax=Erythroxylum novogranatense TaxID=1862640 RepID=A0AAV8T6A0_9ROSI|nr:hypothetical protein K2173_007463 [Erythroxylum novogranatense]
MGCVKAEQGRRSPTVWIIKQWCDRAGFAIRGAHAHPAIAGNVAFDYGEASAEEADNLIRSNKKIKRLDGYLIVDDGGVGEQELRDDSKRKGSYKDSVTGFATGLNSTGGEEDLEVVSEEDFDVEEDDDPACPTVHLTISDKQRIRRMWANTLIVKILGRHIGYRFLVASLKKQCMDDYRVVLEGGPWMVANHILIVMKWRPNFDPFAASIDKATVIVNKLGKPVRVDESTKASTRAKYARISVEVDLKKSLISKFRLKRKIWKVEYEGLHLVCFGCGTYGNRRENCLDEQQVMNTQRNIDEQAPELVAAPLSQEDLGIRPEIVESYGAWMLVQKPQCRRLRTSDTRGKPNPRGGRDNDHQGLVEAADMMGHKEKGKAPQGSRFSVLQTHETDLANHHRRATGVTSSQEQNLPQPYPRQASRGGQG